MWTRIVGFPDYEVSDDGKVRFLGGWRQFGPHKRYAPAGERKAQPHSCGYLQVRLSLGADQWKNKYIHRLVAQAFIPNPQRLGDINHKDGNKYNNHWTNLEWVSRRDNHKHAREVLGIHIRGERHGRRKITEAMAIAIIKANGTQREIADRYGISRSHVGYIRSGKSWSHLALWRG
jgi:hypothetical protein